MPNPRFTALNHWLSGYFTEHAIELEPLSGDAGFRCYYRFSYQEKSYIAVDALPKTSNNHGFVEVAKALEKRGIKVPSLVHYDLSLGFFCLEDLGEILFADALSASSMVTLYQQAIDLLPSIAQCSVSDRYNLPAYDKKFIEFELSIFSEWLLAQHLNIHLSESQQIQLTQCFDYLVENALAQPQVFMHRDYHSRNIMICDQQGSNGQQTLAIIDFQDAVQGPITYDIVSLLRDCYYQLPDEKVSQLLRYFCQQISKQLPLADISEQTWQTWFDLMGLQRHIKASGIFARLYHRDNKTGYLKDIPLTLEYIIKVSANYPKLSFLNELVQQQVLPKVLKQQTDKLSSSQ
ncbi:aminoglycoside phosphotransferase family protein [Thalassotalea sp. PLHSN55]|uniref:aminoglycoside phosphotransferase family protein n=1 Tax=Thalassotalea sp. PLHSN55 TaxID=3435888 RepID=UPI003F849BA2